jgi:hypothetical protein
VKSNHIGTIRNKCSHFYNQYFLFLPFPRHTHTADMKLILPYIVFFLLALTKDIKTASADNLRAPEAEGPTLPHPSDGLTIHLENGQVHRKLKGKGKGKGKVRILGCAP